MRHFIILTFYLIPFFSTGQTRTIIGKVLDENDLTAMPGVMIHTRDTVLIGTTDKNGDFKIELSAETDQLLLGFISMEWTSIKVPTDCDNLEIIMMVDAIYDFVTIQTENKKRYKRFKDLKDKHRQAHAKGIFTSDVPCGTYIFNNH